MRDSEFEDSLTSQEIHLGLPFFSLSLCTHGFLRGEQGKLTLEFLYP